MEGFDGACHFGTCPNGDPHWTTWRMWHTKSYDAASPTAMAPLNIVRPAIYVPACHSPDNDNWVGSSYENQARSLALRTPQGEAPLDHSDTLLWRTGSGDPEDRKSGFQDIVTNGGAVFLHFAFMYPDQGEPTGSDGVIKVWMGDRNQNGVASTGVGKYTDDPGEPSFNFNGIGIPLYQENRLAITISSGSVNNIGMYRTSAGGGPVGAEWSELGSFEIKQGEWYYALWQLRPGAATVGESILRINDVSVCSTLVEDTRDTQDSLEISNLGLAFRGPGNQNSEYPNGTFSNPVSSNNMILIDDICMFYEQSATETYCVILSASAIDSSNNYIPVPGGSLYSTIEESTIYERNPNTQSWGKTSDVSNEIQATYPDFPYVTTDAFIHGVQAMNFCSQNNTTTFDWCSQSLTDQFGTGQTLQSIVPSPGQGMIDGYDNPFVFIRQRIWPTSSVGATFQVSDINILTSSVILGS